MRCQKYSAYLSALLRDKLLSVKGMLPLPVLWAAWASLVVIGLSALSLLSALPAHAESKVLRTAFPVAETGFDPVGTNDLYSTRIVQAVFDRLYTYDYLASPVQLVPAVAEAAPEISSDGKTYTIRIKKSIYFYPDPVFAGKKRELTAEDFVYSFKRLMDPHTHSPNSYFIEGLIVGLDEQVEQAKKTGKFNYDAKVAGLYAADRYTLVIKLKEQSYTLGYILAHSPFSAVAREVIEKYADPTTGRAMNNPVGTGPYYLKEWVKLSKIVLEKNPLYRTDYWTTLSQQAADQPIIKALAGKKLPIIPRIEISIMEEDQSRFLAFEQRQLDIFALEGTLAPKMLINGQLRPEFQRYAYLSQIVDPEISYFQFLMTDKEFGGLAPATIALRRAVFMAMDDRLYIAAMLNGQAKTAHYTIPEGVVGYQPDYQSVLEYNPVAAGLLLDKFGYKIGADGFRHYPDGRPLVITYTTRSDSTGRRGAEFVYRSLAAINLRVHTKLITFPELLKGFKQCSIPFFGAAWIADYPDGENFIQLLYGPNTAKSNNGCGVFPEIDRRIEQSQKLPPGEARDKLYLQINRLAEYYGIWKINFSRYRNIVANKRVIGYRKHPILNQEWMYIDIVDK